MSAAKRWAEAYERAWLAGDGDAAAELYAEDCVFRSHPFRDLESPAIYRRRLLPEAEAPEVWLGEPVEHADVAAVEYRALLVEPDGTESPIAGIPRSRIGPAGPAA